MWGMNIRTVQLNRSDGVELHSAAPKAKMKVGSHECAMCQHNTLPLSYTMWADNSVVKTLSSFHTPELLPAGMWVNRRKRVGGVREYESTPVHFPLQQRDIIL